MAPGNALVCCKPRGLLLRCSAGSSAVWSSDLGKVKCNWEPRVSSCSSEKQPVQDTECAFSVLVSTVSGLLLYSFGWPQGSAPSQHGAATPWPQAARLSPGHPHATQNPGVMLCFAHADCAAATARAERCKRPGADCRELSCAECSRRCCADPQPVATPAPLCQHFWYRWN